MNVVPVRDVDVMTVREVEMRNVEMVTVRNVDVVTVRDVEVVAVRDVEVVPAQSDIHHKAHSTNTDQSMDCLCGLWRWWPWVGTRVG